MKVNIKALKFMGDNKMNDQTSIFDKEEKEIIRSFGGQNEAEKS